MAAIDHPLNAPTVSPHCDLPRSLPHTPLALPRGDE